MPSDWYQEVEATVPVTQGDLMFNCLLIAWKPEPFDSIERRTGLTRQIDTIEADVVVMTQACDLEQDKVSNVVVCPHFSLSEYREDWEAEMTRKHQNPTTKAWKSHCEDICDGYVWNLAMLNAHNSSSQSTEHRIVNFHHVFTLPRSFIESLLREGACRRLRLLPPYREHLSQAFARFFMRVGLPISVTRAW
jgi:hypothetical protein